MNKLIALSVMVALPTSAAAQSSVAPAPSTTSAPVELAPLGNSPQPFEAAGKTYALPANTEVVLRLSDELTSKGNQHKVGHMFRLTVAYDVKVNGTTVIPSGTQAVGEVTYRTGKGVFGKSGKLEVELRHVDLNGQRIPVTGKYRQEGEGNTTAAIGAVVLAAGLLFVTGKSAVIPRGRELSAYTAQTTNIVIKQPV
jgi:hypothetical protein